MNKQRRVEQLNRSILRDSKVTLSTSGFQPVFDAVKSLWFDVVKSFKTLFKTFDIFASRHGVNAHLSMLGKRALSSPSEEGVRGSAVLCSMNKTNKNLNNSTTQYLINLKNFNKDGVRDILADRFALPLAPSSEGENAFTPCKTRQPKIQNINTNLEGGCKKCLA